ncbi:LacI family DNA-binding transcriptional regulator [Sporolactobacillus shoreicorticis]|uniref:LacI family DNA-binding transcriptional regulator n=1 Tax=Sporolactobacillus shoreicorticis TaxID=1923877 RepID=A0ABW5S2F2_9BACL|nr:LacI family DNA-binding transcriptional regulator [Sporolactobacillus shoreicorticis]MCO7127857.1 LacI family DNA-binding transcriptional regulator [Sporolactobacillus shoreicorticis]
MPTIRDISKLAKVSPGTVSRALNPTQQKNVSEETRIKVQQIAKNLGYQHFVKKNKEDKRMTPPLLHFALLTTHTIEEETKDEYWRFVRLGIYQAAKAENISIEKVIDMHNGIDPKQVANYDAVLIIGTVSLNVIKSLKEVNTNLVVIDGGVDYDGLVDTVDPNFKKLTIETLDKMSAYTDKEIAIISGNRREIHMDGTVGNVIEDPRVKAYKAWTKTHGKKELFKKTEWSNNAAMKATDSLINDYGNVLSAIIVTSDSLLLVGVMKSLAKHGIVPGKQIMLVSFDDMEFVSFLTPAPSSIWIPKAELGYAAILHAVTLTKKSSKNWITQIVIPGKIRYRDTFRPASMS